MTDQAKPQQHTDIKKLVWIEKHLPPGLRLYAYLMRIDRPIGIWLLLLPGLWGLTLAANGIPPLSLILLFTLGATLMRGAGCIINDIWDRDLDRQVERTRVRPLAAGTLSVKQALLFLSFLLLLSLLILLQLNTVSILLGCLTIPLIITYPLMKRITFWPQIMLGITFNLSTLIGYTAITGTITLPALLLYTGALLWTIGYDTIYAHQDKDDDALIGVKSTALKFGDKSKIWISGFYAAALLCILLSKPVTPHSALIILPVLHTAWQIKTWDINNQKSALKTFKSNTLTGLLILIFIMA